MKIFERAAAMPTSFGWASLSVTRFFLASCVIITHSGIISPNTKVFELLGQTGYPAVFAFFLISGFSIAHSIKQNPHRFYFRRFRRIYPEYCLAILLSLATTFFGPLTLPNIGIIYSPSLFETIGNLLMLQGFFVNPLATDGPVWSLSIEWWLYMLAPFLARISFFAVFTLSLASFLGLVIFYQCMGYIQVLPLGLNIFFLSFAWLAGFTFFQKRTILTFMNMIIPSLILFNYYIDLKYGSLIIIFTALIIGISNINININKYILSTTKTLGDLSYPLYLMHVPLLFYVGANMKNLSNSYIPILVIYLSVITLFIIYKGLSKVFYIFIK